LQFSEFNAAKSGQMEKSVSESRMQKKNTYILISNMGHDGGVLCGVQVNGAVGGGAAASARSMARDPVVGTGLRAQQRWERQKGGRVKGERSSKESGGTTHEAERGTLVWAWCAATHHSTPRRAPAAAAVVGRAWQGRHAGRSCRRAQSPTARSNHVAVQFGQRRRRRRHGGGHQAL
jgi:hypothetical protein